MRSAVILAYSAALIGTVTALWAAVRQPRSIPKYSFVAGMLLMALESLFTGLTANTEVSADAAEWQRWRMLAMALAAAPWLLFTLTYARGNAREFILRWRFRLIAALVVPLGLTGLFYEKLIGAVTVIPGIPSRLFHLTVPALSFYVVFLLITLLALMNLERTFRASVGTMRWRIKYMVLGVGVLFAVRAYTSSQVLLWIGRGMDDSLLRINSVGLLFCCALVLRSILRDPAEVAVYPSAARLQNSLIPLVAGIYLLAVGVFAKFVQWLGVDASFEAKAFLILVATIGVTLLGLSDRARMHGRRFFSRYLQRPLYDYRSVWRSFIEATASRVKQEELCEAAVKQIAEIFQVLSVTIWLVDDKKENLSFVASTSLSFSTGSELGPQREDAVAIIRKMEEQSEPVDIESSKEPWAEALRRSHPSQFRTGGSRVCVPMTAGRQLMGVITLGDRVGGIFFSLQDFDLLKCVGDQVAAGLLNAQLSQKLLQAKELEAFQTMSAFFVHDLKNTASTLNLMLQNLPVHFDNPEFRADALRGVAKTCDHINHLIGRLSLLRHNLQIQPAELDLNDVIGRVLSNWNGTPGVNLVKNFRPCPKILLDQEQILKVVTNLVLNATEAVGKDGEVRVETSQSNGWAILAVTDNGCGMTPEFARRALFRPFQTTKKNG
ncbi:MAG TPA: XrtA/PEP-CTERM system histidine kinase PrsK, partial [Candidatus Saccharimonadales bacterium]|nr:XrtA/PEP-CTERM system histidine kinase PrsK [Candidatus Saccharimonadales bacterium]